MDDRQQRVFRIAVIGFLVAAGGVALGFSIDHRPVGLWHYLALAVTIAGIAIVGLCVLWGWYDFFRLLWPAVRRKGRRSDP